MKWKNKLHLSAPFKAQGCGGNLSILKPGGAHTSTHTHTGPQTKQPPRMQCILFGLSRTAWQARERTEMGEIPKNYLKCSFVCLKEKQENGNGWESSQVEVDIQGHTNWMGLAFLISSNRIFSTISRATFFLPPNLQMNDIEGKIVLSRVMPIFQIAWRKKC